MTIRSFKGVTPTIDDSVFVDDTALLIGDIVIGEHSSVWPMTVIRGDVHSIEIGKYTNIQDGSILHVTHDGEFSPGGQPLKIGDYVTAGHRVLLHACEVQSYCLIGMSSTIMDGAVVEEKTIVGAGSLVPTGRTLESGYLYVGTPAKRVRELNEKELAFLEYSAKYYAQLKDEHKT